VTLPDIPVPAAYQEAGDEAYWRDSGPVITIRQRTLTGVLVTLLLHALLLFLIMHLDPRIVIKPQGNEGAISYIDMSSPKKTTVARVEAPKHTEPAASPSQRQQVNHSRPTPRPVPPTPPPVEDKTAIHAETPPPSPPVAVPEATDMASYVAAMKARRQAAEQVGRNPEDGPQPSADDVRMANIRRNLQPGTSGIFQIVNMSMHSAQFTFRGWTTSRNNSHLELIEVEAGPNEDIQRAIVKKMIALIRRYYKGDFDFESQRLGRVVSLSARIEDTAGLEDFLMREFFNVRG